MKKAKIQSLAHASADYYLAKNRPWRDIMALSTNQIGGFTMATEKYTDEETMKIIEDSFAANDRGDYEEEKRLIRLLPLDPAMAKTGKRIYGSNFLIEEGFDLSLANDKFGDGWLDKDDNL